LTTVLVVEDEPDVGARRHDDASTQQPSRWSSTMPADCMRA
jgi:hypothetical protein